MTLLRDHVVDRLTQWRKFLAAVVKEKRWWWLPASLPVSLRNTVATL
jgi:hypothetical protein